MSPLLPYNYIITRNKNICFFVLKLFFKNNDILYINIKNKGEFILNIILPFIIIIATIVLLGSIIPLCQYFYHRFIKRENYSLRYYFSQELFDRHLSYDVGLSDVRVINNRKEMEKLWDIEMVHMLP